MKTPASIIISRTDNIGDVVLTLPMAGALKEVFPDVKISFIGKAYTESVILCSGHVDHFLDKDKILSGEITITDLQADVIIYVFPEKAIVKAFSKANIPVRIGTSHRWFHWLYANRLVNLGRKKSDLHEAQLNLKLLGPLGIIHDFSLDKIAGLYGFSIQKLRGLENVEKLLSSNNPGKLNIIFHPKSKGSGREWKLENYFQLIKSLPTEKYNAWVTGSREEGEKIIAEMPGFFKDTHAIDLTGKLSLSEFIIFISRAKTLVACGTGPLHIAAAFGINTVGLFPPIRPIHPGRWAPVGKKTKVFCIDKDCSNCAHIQNCACINSIKANEVKDFIITLES